MAMGDEDYSGDYTDSGESEYGDDLSRYSQEAQDYIRANSQTRINGVPVGDDGKNTAGFGKFGRKKDEDGNSKWGLLKKGEKEASKKPNAGGRGGDKNASLGEKENNVGSDSDDQSTTGKFKNAVQGIKDIKNGKISKGKGKLKKAGPLMAILALCCGFGGASFFGQMSMPFSLINQFQESFDSISVSQNMRSKSFLKYQTMKEDGKIHDCIKAHYFKADEFKVTSRQRNKLAKSGITFEEEGGITVMKHMRANGEVQTIVADPSQAGEGRIYFNEAFENDTEFRNNYIDGARTWRGAVGAWFDTSMNKLLNKLGVQRGVWRDFKSGKTQAEGMDEMRTTIAGDSDTDSARTKAGGSDVTTTGGEDDGHGGTTPRTNEVTEGTKSDVDISRADVEVDSKGKVTNADGLKTKLKGIGSKVAKVSGITEAAVGIYCGIADFVAAVSAIVAAYQAMQIVSVAANIFEGIQKAQAGDGDSAPLHEISQSLTQRSTNTYETVDAVNSNGDATKSTTTERDRSAMEANAVGAIYGGKSVDMTDPSVKSFNINTITKNMYSGVASVLNYVSVSASAYRSCAVARLAAAAAGVVVDVVTVVACIASFGIGCLVDFIVDNAGSAAFSAALSLAISAAVGVALPFVAKILTRKIATEVLGEDLGNALVSGANMYMGKNHQYSGGAVANKESLIAYLQERDRVVAENARYERETRSPFDVTSKYTFLGSLAAQMIPLASSATSLTGVIQGASTVVGGAINSLTPKSSAVSAAIEAQVAAETTEKYCPDMAEIGGVADAFCNPYVITDTRTMDTQPAEIVNSIGDEDLEADADGNPVVKKDSDLAKYIVYCGQRQSPWGQADQNIAGEVATAGNVGGTVGSSIIGAIPIVGDSFDIVSNSQKLANFGWISGESCVVNNTAATNGFSDSINWEKGKVYQRFIEDQRLAESEGIIEKSAVTTFLAEYYEEHPLDNSYEGILARYSGLTKDNVVAVLDFFEVQEWLANYDPTDFAPSGHKKEMIKDENEYQIEQGGVVASVLMNIMPKYDAYIERRNAYNYSA